MNIYKALEKIIIVKPFALGASLFSEDMEAELDSDEDIIIWELLKNISSLGVKITENTVKFYPMIVWEGKSGGKKCLSPAKKYKVYKSSINKSLHFAQRRLSSSTRG